MIQQTDIIKPSHGSKHWTYDEEKLLIDVLLSHKNDVPGFGLKIVYTTWLQVTDAINHEFGTSRTVESIKKHYRKLRTKYLVIIHLIYLI